MEKAMLREAFADYLPGSVLWRQKERFSDGVGGLISRVPKQCQAGNQSRVSSPPAVAWDESFAMARNLRTVVLASLDKTQVC